MATESGVRVLLADDDEDFLVSLRELIEAQRELSVVATATNGLSAIELVDELAPDAVVLDLHMMGTFAMWWIARGGAMSVIHGR